MDEIVCFPMSAEEAEMSQALIEDIKPNRLSYLFHSN